MDRKALESGPESGSGEKRRVLFLCTGNYYRSRFAEALFNHHAATLAPGWTACSRGLATHLAEGDLSPYVLEALAQRGIERRHTAETRCPLCDEDLLHAEVVVALSDAEHRPMIARRYPEWEGRVRFWDVSDVDFTAPGEALPRIEALVLELLASLRSSS
jgi:protein-tyrosine phosphatase